MAAGVAEKFFWLSKTFSGSFVLIVYSSQDQVKLKGKRDNQFFIVLHGLKDFRMSRFQVVPFTISANFGFHPCMKIYARENPYKNGAVFGSFLAQKKTVKSDKLH